MNACHSRVLLALSLLLVACPGGGSPPSEPSISEAAEIPAGSCAEMLPLCEEAGLSAEQCCDEARAATCSGGVVSLTISSGTQTSSVSERDCLDKLDEPVRVYCQGGGRPGNCSGTCPSGDCGNTGEATNKRTTRAGPPTWSCEATRGRCFCDCL